MLACRAYSLRVSDNRRVLTNTTLDTASKHPRADRQGTLSMQTVQHATQKHEIRKACKLLAARSFNVVLALLALRLIEPSSIQ